MASEPKNQRIRAREPDDIVGGNADQPSGCLSEPSIQVDARRILERIADGFVAVDRQWRYTFVNRRAVEIIGKTSEELLGKIIWEVTPETAGTRFQQACRRAMDDQVPVSLEEYYPRLEAWHEKRIHPDPDGLSIYFQNITARKRTEDELRHNEKLYSTLIHSIKGIVWAADPKTFQFTFVSQQAEQLLGYPAQQWIDEPTFWRDHTHPDDVDWCSAFCIETTARGEDHEFEYRMIAADGRVVWLRDIVTIRHADDGSMQLRGIMIDITEQKLAQEAIANSEQRLRLIFDTEPECVKLLDPEGRVLDMNAAGLAMIEADSLDQVRGATLYPLVSPEHREECIDLVTRVSGGDTGKMELEVVGLKGTRRWLELHAAPMRSQDETISQVLGVTRDVTDWKRAQAALSDSEDRWRTMFDNAALAIAVVDSEGFAIQCNPALQRMLGYTQDELSRMRFLDFTHPDDVPRDRTLFRELLSGKIDHYRIEKRYITKDGELRWGNLTAFVIPPRNSDGPLGVGMIEDVTERKRLEEQLLQAQKMEAVGRLAGGVAHDFNNILTAILGYSQVLLSRLDVNDPLRQKVSEIERAGRRAAELTMQLLAFSRKQILQPKVLDLNEVVAESARMVRRLIGEDLELVIDLAPELGRIKADPGQIEQIVVNLSVNARDAMPHGGKVMLTTSNVELQTGEGQRFGDLEPGLYVMLSVSDTGEGMTESVRARIFEPFFTTKELGKGTGLGLSTVYGIVKQSEGEICVLSSPGTGTTFEIVFPRVAEVITPDEKPAEDLEMPRGTETILLVEDEEMVRSLARDFLEENGYNVLDAEDGAEALKVAVSHKGRIDLVLTDVVMPMMSGKELMERLWNEHPHTRVVYTSGYTEDAIVHHGVLDEGIDFLPKPFSLEALARKVREVLDRAHD